MQSRRTKHIDFELLKKSFVFQVKDHEEAYQLAKANIKNLSLNESGKNVYKT